MPKNKPQNLEEWLKKKNFYYGGKRVKITPLMVKFANVVAFQSCDAVRVEEKRQADIIQLTVTDQATTEGKLHYQLEYGKRDGFNSAIKAQEEKAKAWLGEGEK